MRRKRRGIYFIDVWKEREREEVLVEEGGKEEGQQLLHRIFK